MAQKNKLAAALACPCGGGLRARCCGPLLDLSARAATAEQLMRSRYSAYALGLSAYVLQTWHPSTRPTDLDLAGEQAFGKWIGLTVLKHSPLGERAEVEFVARYKPTQGPASRLHERSRFVLEEGQWFYLDGDLDPS